ncbi:MAG TPA: ribonuclease P protein component [Dongiaceae bacterium]|nr:ribonuclease P protein component [Dongiaceae bacterium]
MARTPPSAAAAIAKSIEFASRGTVTAGVPEESNKSVERRSGKTAFPRSGRLLRHADFKRVYEGGRRHFSTSMTVFYLERTGAESANADSGLRVGFTVGKALGGAVQRNRMKRRLREAVRLTRPVPGPSADVVINPKKTVLTADFDLLLNEVRQAFVVIEKKLSVARPQPR